MRCLLKIMFFTAVGTIAYGNLCFAQKKLHKTTERAIKGSIIDTISSDRKDDKPSSTLVPMYKEKVITIEKPAKKRSFKDLPIIYDTVHAKPKRVLGQETIIDDSKTTVVTPKDSKDNSKDKDSAVGDLVIEKGSCKCVLMNMKVQDTIDYENYINYSFIFQNKCKDLVWIHSGSFRFLVNDVFGHQVTRIRTVDFVKRYDYPEYVKLSPGETFEFNFADDPFFEYKMNRSQEYKFSFMYNNTGAQVKDNKKTGKKVLTNVHQCLEVRDKSVYVR